jgi:protein-tyrosine kinase
MDLIERAAARLAQQDAKAGARPEQHEDSTGSSNFSEPVLHPVATLHRANEDSRPLLKLDEERLRQAGMVVPDSTRSKIKEEYRHIKRPLLMNAAGKGTSVLKHANLIMVTSSHPGEGKTFTAANLALSIAAERDKTVLLVDADVVRPSLGNLLGFSAEKGLVDHLIDPTLDVGELLIKTELPTLTILPAGTPHHLSTELLASTAMQTLTEELSNRYRDRIVIFDSPPLLPTTESCVLAHLMGQIVIVVEAERTTRRDVRESIERLGALPETAVGFVLNKTRHEMDPGYYGYGYGYGY